MFPKKALSTLISELNGRIPPPVHTGGIEEERPVPAVLVDNIDLQNKNHHNSHYSGSSYDSSGTETDRYFRYYYALTVELTVRAQDEIKAYEHLGQVQAALSNIARDPVNKLHNDVHEVKVQGSGPVSYQFIEPTETELNQSLVVESFYETTDSSLDTIQSLQQNIDIS